MELIGVYLAACVLLAGAGLAKAIRPAGTMRAVSELVSWPPALLTWLVRAAAAAEAGLGVLGLAFPNRELAALVAVSFLAFGAFVAVVRVRGGPLSTCGCFGTPDTPATWLHSAIDVGFAASAASVAAASLSGNLLAVLGHQPWSGVPVALAGAVCAWLAYLVMSPLAVLGEARRLAGGSTWRRD